MLESMSMGEAGLNQKPLASAIEILNVKYPNARLLISTSAPDVPYDTLFDVSKRIDTVGLQFSVHESTDEARAKLIPTKTMSLDKIARTGEAWHKATGRKPFFNYCAHDNNSSVEDAQRLRELFNPAVWEATISVICERNEGLTTRNNHQVALAQDFSGLLLSQGFNVRVFDPAGQDDIGGGCGQLWYVQDTIREKLLPEGKARESRGFGLPILHTPGND